MPTWDICICSIPHRHEQFSKFLAHLGSQIRPGVRVLVYRDNLERGYGEKCQALLDAADADYVSFLDDDDWVADDFIPRCSLALESRPDYVGFKVRYTIDGVPQMPVIHSLEFSGWANTPNLIYRDIVHFNPIRLSLARQGRWFGGYGADRTWAEGVRGSGLCRTQVFIDDEIHHYQWSSQAGFQGTRQPVAPDAIPPLPSYPWLVTL